MAGDDDAVFEVGSDGGGQDPALGLPAPSDEVLDRVSVRRCSYSLLDDRAVVENRSGVVGSGPDQFHPSLHRLVIGPGTGERRQEGVVDVYNPPFPLLDEVGGQDLHVTRQDNQVDIQLGQHPIELCLLRGLRLRRHRQMVKRNPETLGDVTSVLVVAEDRRYRCRDVPDSPPADQVDQTVGVPGGEDGDFLVRIHRTDRPVPAEVGGQRAETGAELVQIERIPRRVEVDTQEELVVGDRLALLGAEDVAALVEEVSRDAGHDPRLIGAGPEKDGGFGHAVDDGSCPPGNARAYPREMTDLVVITGASKGLGAALARTVPFPAHVVDISRSGSDVADVEHVEADLTRSNDWDRVGKEIGRLVVEHDPGRIVMIHNAGMLTPIGFAGEVDTASYTSNVVLNSAAGQVLGHHFLRAVAGRSGRRELIMISSGAATSVYPGWSSYGAAKAAIDQWVRNVGAEQKLRGGVMVAAIAPGVVDTDMQELIREMDERDFPSVERFHELNRDGDLADPETAASKVWNAIESGLESGSVVDVRDY